MAQDHTRYKSHVDEFFSKLNTEDFDIVNCPICKNSNEAELFKKDSMTVFRCECGMVYNKRQANQRSLDRFYEESAAMSTWVDIKKTDAEFKRQSEKFQGAVDLLTDMGVSSVLDIGCGTGFFLSMFDPSVKTVGTEQNKASIEEARSKGIEVWDASIDEFFSSSMYYRGHDAISLWGVLEHAKDPIGLLRSIHGRLEVGGHVCICVPNVESMVVKRFWKDTFTFCPQHLWYFSPSTLQAMLNLCGFSVEASWTIEAEERPILKGMAGFAPYDEIPSWARDQIFEDEHVRLFGESIIETDQGYKVVMIGKKNGFDSDSSSEGGV